MKRLARILTSLVLMLAMPVPSIAQTHVIAELGTAPLIGQIASTPQLQADVARQQTLFRRAGAKLGLTPAEYAEFQSRIASKQLSYVTIPRRLDAMSWSSGGNVYVLHDVVIPASTNGWEVDVQEHDTQIALFIPARCGNLSVVRRSIPRIAKTSRVRRTMPVAVAPEATAPPAPAAPPAQGPAVAIAPQAPVTPPPAYQSVASSTPVVHHPRLWPLLLLPLLGFIAGGHSAGSVSTLTPPTSNAPAPLPSPGCPQPTPH
ncbi:MAG: hypothetical protein ABR508_12460 [Candidatus Baltobacteraceae bacterium]